MTDFFHKPPLTRSRIVLALAITILADAIQLIPGPLGWAFIDQIIDVIAMVLLSFTVGFHVLFLPTFVAELIPAVTMFPTWTACLLIVMAQRRKRKPPRFESPPARPDSDVIDV